MHMTERDIFSNYFLVGVNHSFSPKFSVNLNAGAELDTPRQGATQTSPYAEMTTTYAYQRLSNLQWYLHYGFDHSALTLNDKHTALRTGVRITQAIFTKMSLSFGIFYQHDDSSQTVGASNTTTEDTFDISTGLHYTVTPKLTLDATFTHTEVLSNIASSEYSRNRITLGANYTF
jgi:predicted porin